jgi:hypothetical protein
MTGLEILFCVAAGLAAAAFGLAALIALLALFDL